MPGKLFALSLLGVSLAAASASATTFSFRSDDNHQRWTLTGNGNTITADTQLQPYQLLIDDDNGPLAPVAFDVRLIADFSIALVNVTNVGGSSLYVYALNGGFSFVDFNTNAPILSGQVSNGAATNFGPAGTWGTSGNLQGNDLAPATSVTYQWNGPTLPGHGVYTGQTSVGLDDFGFTLTALVSGAAAPLPGVPLGSNGLPIASWLAEGSFSGTAFFLPSPGSAALAGLGLTLIAPRRKR